MTPNPEHDPNSQPAPKQPWWLWFFAVVSTVCCALYWFLVYMGPQIGNVFSRIGSAGLD